MLKGPTIVVEGSEVAAAHAKAANVDQLRQRFEAHNQGHVFRFWDTLEPDERAALEAAFGAIRDKLGPGDVLVYNAAMGSFAEFMDLEAGVLEGNFQINTMGLFHCGQLAAADMLDNGAGSIVITGNTSARRGKANFAGFAPTKAAQRILGESMARSLGPKGIHVSYLVIDAVIDLEWTRKRMPDAPDDYFARPADIAESVWQLAHQPKSTWTFETEIRPFAENW